MVVCNAPSSSRTYVRSLVSTLSSTYLPCWFSRIINGDDVNCPVRALGRRYCHLMAHGASPKTILSAYYHNGKRCDVTSEHISKALKEAATALEYPILKGIPIDRINTHSLRSGGANALALAGYSDTQIQKMGRWRGATFKEYVRNELACFPRWMARFALRQDWDRGKGLIEMKVFRILSIAPVFSPKLLITY